MSSLSCSLFVLVGFCRLAPILLRHPPQAALLQKHCPLGCISAQEETLLLYIAVHSKVSCCTTVASRRRFRSLEEAVVFNRVEAPPFSTVGRRRRCGHLRWKTSPLSSEGDAMLFAVHDRGMSLACPPLTAVRTGPSRKCKAWVLAGFPPRRGKRSRCRVWPSRFTCQPSTLRGREVAGSTCICVR